jgi:hypothetical protein
MRKTLLSVGMPRGRVRGARPTSAPTTRLEPVPVTDVFGARCGIATCDETGELKRTDRER